MPLFLGNNKQFRPYIENYGSRLAIDRNLDQSKRKSPVLIGMYWRALQ